VSARVLDVRAELAFVRAELVEPAGSDGEAPPQVPYGTTFSIAEDRFEN